MKNIVWHPNKVTRNDREKIKNQKGCVLWFTGLSGSGKSTIANELEYELNKMRYHTYLLDGDNIRHGLIKNLGFSDLDRKENIRRISEVAKLFVDAGIITITAFISPFIEDREKAREIIGTKNFIEVFVDTPLEVCIQRDPKGLYKKALNGEIKNFTGIDSPYERPLSPEIIIDTKKYDIISSVSLIIDYLKNKKYLDFR
ncbi:adenylyl-sulfate kinase [Lebetimonas sp. JH369]|uniref:adenylyl-sulfate kinase n=1 Tax=Lebetimonas sp. JH369 TaxID=990069 RepID=UPI0004BACB58|nr:adenylyl-sulfate kinase [Lebetimonas sp. JH369]